MWPIITVIIIGLEINPLCMEPTNIQTCFRPAGLQNASVSVVGVFLELKAEVEVGEWPQLQPLLLPSLLQQF